MVSSSPSTSCSCSTTAVHRTRRVARRGKGRCTGGTGTNYGLRRKRTVEGRCAARGGGSGGDKDGDSGGRAAVSSRSRLSREERDLAENVKGLLQRERVRLDRDVRQANSASSSTNARGIPSTPSSSPSPSVSPSASAASAPTSPFARQSSFRSGGGGAAADPFASAGAGTTRRTRVDRSSVRETIEADEATPQTAEDAKVTWIWERIDAEQLVRHTLPLTHNSRNIYEARVHARVRPH